MDYTLPPAEGERESASKRRGDRHRDREVRKLRRMDLSGAAERHAAADAERHRVTREHDREVGDVLDRVIVRIERQFQREGRACSQAAKPWRCPAGCRNGMTLLGRGDDRQGMFCPCARAAFRLQCLPSRADIQRQQRALWDDEHLTKVFISSYSGHAYHSKMQRQLRAEEDRQVEAWRPTFEVAESEVDVEIQQNFLALWDGKLASLLEDTHYKADGRSDDKWKCSKRLPLVSDARDERDTRYCTRGRPQEHMFVTRHESLSFTPFT